MNKFRLFTLSAFCSLFLFTSLANAQKSKPSAPKSKATQTAQTPDARLVRLLKADKAILAVEKTPTAPVAFGIAGVDYTPEVTEVFSGEKKIGSYLFQADGKHDSPIANTGSTLFYFNPATQKTTPFKVTARKKVKGDPNHCETGGNAFSGWAYSVDGKLPERTEETQYDFLFLPAYSSHTPAPTSVPDAVRKSAWKTFSFELNKRWKEVQVENADWYKEMPDQKEGMQVTMFGDDMGKSRFDEAQVGLMRTNKGLAYVYPMNMNDLSGSWGENSTRFSVLYDEQGEEIGRVDFYSYGPFYAIDINGDGVDELLGDNTLVFWNGSKWVTPPTTKEEEYESCS